MTPAASDARRLRLSLWALLAVLGFWLLSQTTVATWLARQADVQKLQWQAGDSPWFWDFTQGHSYIPAGSSGLEQARQGSRGLEVTLPGTGRLDLLLALRGHPPAPAAVQSARLMLETEARTRVLLLAHLENTHVLWGEGWIEPGQQRQELALKAPQAPRIQALQLRLEAAPGTRLRLARLELRAPDCLASAAGCQTYQVQAPPAVTPESLLHWRDAQLARQPESHVVARGPFGRIGAWLAGWTLPFPPWWPGLLLLLGLCLAGLKRRWQAGPPVHPARLALELLLPLALTVAALLGGWPERDTPPVASLWLGLCLAAWLLPPAPPMPPLRWLGDAAAWRAALGLSLIGLLLLAPLALLEPAPVRSMAALQQGWRYPAWALLQQWLLVQVIVPRLWALLRQPDACALAAGLIFALLHAPNFALMLFTALAGTAWAWLGLQRRALLPLAVSHAVLGSALPLLAPDWLLRSAEIGGRYLMAP